LRIPQRNNRILGREFRVILKEPLERIRATMIPTRIRNPRPAIASQTEPSTTHGALPPGTQGHDVLVASAGLGYLCGYLAADFLSQFW
jgi:hypothetical protein